MAVKEFHDLSELQLNINSVNGKIESSWGNLGFWAPRDNSKHALNYPQACHQLACNVADMANLNSDHRLLDTGFGCGDQLVVWLEEYKVNNVTGINLSVSQTQHAQQKVTALNIDSSIAWDLRVADCCESSAWQGLDKKFDRIIALDCIYHFPHKQQYFALCKQHLAKGGALVVSDLLLSTGKKRFWQQWVLKAICYFSHIPFQNFKTIDEYQAQLSTEGLVISKHQDISEQVFLPFGLWLEQYIAELNNSKNVSDKYSWLKYRGTAKFLRWGYQENIFLYHLLRIEHNGNLLLKSEL
mgnify:CR=1 FL=1